ELKHSLKRRYLGGAEKRRTLTRKAAAALVRKYIKVKPYVQDRVDQIVYSLFDGIFTIGVHYRGTDKKEEAPRVSYKTVFKKIKKQIAHLSSYQIFVATDEEAFLQAIQKEFPNKVLALDAYRSQGDVGVHFQMCNRYEIGLEALMDALLLSRC